MRRLAPCLVVTLLVLTACDKKKAPTEYGHVVPPPTAQPAAVPSAQAVLSIAVIS